MEEEKLRNGGEVEEWRRRNVSDKSPQRLLRCQRGPRTTTGPSPTERRRRLFFQLFSLFVGFVFSLPYFHLIFFFPSPSPLNEPERPHSAAASSEPSPLWRMAAVQHYGATAAPSIHPPAH